LRHKIRHSSGNRQIVEKVISEIMKKHILLSIVGVFGYCGLMAQAGTISNSSNGPTFHLGWDVFTGIPLSIKHENNRSIRFSTDSLLHWGIRNDGFVLGGTVNPLYNAVLNVRASGLNGGNYAVYGRSIDGAAGNFAAMNASNNAACVGLAVAPSISTNIGVYGRSLCGEDVFSAGIAGEIRDLCSEDESWAGFFVGKTFCSEDDWWEPSDEALKTDITTLVNVSGLIALLAPVQYEYQVPEASDLILPLGLQYGLIAQELEEHIPIAVTDVVHTGGLQAIEDGLPPLHFKGVNYRMLIPLLVANFQESQLAYQDSQEQLQQINEEIYILENLLAIEKLNSTK
jgi:hypothetical protein